VVRVIYPHLFFNCSGEKCWNWQAAQNISGIQTAFFSGAEYIWFKDQDTIYPSIRELKWGCRWIYRKVEKNTPLGPVGPSFYWINRIGNRGIVRFALGGRRFQPKQRALLKSRINCLSPVYGMIILKNAYEAVGGKRWRPYTYYLTGWLSRCWRANAQSNIQVYWYLAVVIEHNLWWF